MSAASSPLHHPLTVLSALGRLFASLLGASSALKCVREDEVPEDTLTSSDVAALLGRLELEHPAGVILRDAARAHLKEHGTGLTSLAAFAGTLATEVATLRDAGVRDAVLQQGLEAALAVCRAVLARVAVPLVDYHRDYPRGCPGGPCRPPPDTLASPWASSDAALGGIKGPAAATDAVASASSANARGAVAWIGPGTGARQGHPLTLAAAAGNREEASAGVGISDNGNGTTTINNNNEDEGEFDWFFADTDEVGTPVDSRDTENGPIAAASLAAATAEAAAAAAAAEAAAAAAEAVSAADAVSANVGATQRRRRILELGVGLQHAAEGEAEFDDLGAPPSPSTSCNLPSNNTERALALPMRLACAAGLALQQCDTRDGDFPRGDSLHGEPPSHMLEPWDMSQIVMHRVTGLHAARSSVFEGVMVVLPPSACGVVRDMLGLKRARRHGSRDDTVGDDGSAAGAAQAAGADGAAGNACDHDSDDDGVLLDGVVLVTGSCAVPSLTSRMRGRARRRMRTKSTAPPGISGGLNAAADVDVELAALVASLRDLRVGVVVTQADVPAPVMHACGAAGIVCVPGVRLADLEALALLTGAALLADFCELRPWYVGGAVRATLDDRGWVSESQARFIPPQQLEKGQSRPREAPAKQVYLRLYQGRGVLQRRGSDIDRDTDIGSSTLEMGGRVVTVVVHGQSEPIVAELEGRIRRCLFRLLGALRDGVVVPGGMGTELFLVGALQTWARVWRHGWFQQHGIGGDGESAPFAPGQLDITSTAGALRNGRFERIRSSAGEKGKDDAVDDDDYDCNRDVTQSPAAAAVFLAEHAHDPLLVSHVVDQFAAALRHLCALAVHNSAGVERGGPEGGGTKGPFGAAALGHVGVCEERCVEYWDTVFGTCVALGAAEEGGAAGVASESKNARTVPGVVGRLCQAVSMQGVVAADIARRVSPIQMSVAEPGGGEYDARGGSDGWAMQGVAVDCKAAKMGAISQVVGVVTLAMRIDTVLVMQPNPEAT